ncbi:MAG: exonuclease SbcCD subunit D C-terminal domain-containing protein [Ferruginibacter sp.]
MKILHTADWHLGRSLYSKKERHEEHLAFFNWLLKTIQEKKIELLLIAGDVFDTSSPSSTCQKLYYDLLIQVLKAGCRSVVVVGGNHDSPSFLNAPKDALAALNIHIVGCATENIADELVVINDEQNKPQLIIAAVPFLRERDISHFAEGEQYSDRSKRVNENIRKHYAAIGEIAELKKQELGLVVPIIATGHLSVAGGKRNEDDGVREIYVGNIQAVGCDIFPDVFEYVALGHYHIPSAIKNHIRYCGSPIPMGFGEADQTKCVYVLDFTPTLSVETVAVPCFQKLVSIIGDQLSIAKQLQVLKNAESSVWVEIMYDGEAVFTDLASWIQEETKDSLIEVLKIQNRQHVRHMLSATSPSEALEELTIHDVFNRLLEKTEIPEEQRLSLKETYQEIIENLNANS